MGRVFRTIQEANFEVGRLESLIKGVRGELRALQDLVAENRRLLIDANRANVKSNIVRSVTIKDEIHNHVHNLNNPHQTSDENLVVSDVTDNNVSTSAHGFTPKAPNSKGQVLRGDAAWSTEVDYSSGAFKIGDVTGGNYVEFEDDGTIELIGDATVFDDLRIPGLSTKTGANDPDFGAFLGAGDLMVYLFDGAGALVEEVFFVVQLPHGYKEETDIVPHVHWAPTTAAAGTVVWQLEYTWANINAAFGASTTIEIADDTAEVAWTHQMATFSAISGTGKTISSMLVCRLFRDPAHASDDYGADAAFLEIDFHYQIDTIGSRTVSTK